MAAVHSSGGIGRQTATRVPVPTAPSTEKSPPARIGRCSVFPSHRKSMCTCPAPLCWRALLSDSGTIS